MSSHYGKIGVVGVETLYGQKVIALKFFQARNPAWMERLFFAEYDDRATWIDGLRPAFGEKEWFFERDYRNIVARTEAGEGSSGQLFQEAEP